MTSSEKEQLIKRKSQICKEFIYYLTHTIVRLYPGIDALNEETSITHHYNYCYNETCDEFKKQGIDFSNNDELRKKLYTYFLNEFYSGRFTTFEETIEIWKNVFNPEIYFINREVLNVFSNTYTIFNKSIENKKTNKLSC